MADDQKGSRPAHEEPPPFGGTWTGLYALVIGGLVFWIVAFWLFTRAFER